LGTVKPFSIIDSCVFSPPSLLNRAAIDFIGLRRLVYSCG
jgi:hypothetical protein